MKQLVLLALLFLLTGSPAFAAEPLVAWGSAGMIGTYPGIGAQLSTGAPVHKLHLKLQAGGFVRANTLEGAGGGLLTAATGSVELYWPLGAGRSANIGPLAILDGLAVSAFENRIIPGCGRAYQKWIPMGGDWGIAVEPSLGLGWHTQSRRGDGRGMDMSLTFQSTRVYNVSIPMLPRIAVSLRTGGGWRFGGEFQRLRTVATIAHTL